MEQPYYFACAPCQGTTYHDGFVHSYLWLASVTLEQTHLVHSCGARASSALAVKIAHASHETRSLAVSSMTLMMNGRNMGEECSESSCHIRPGNCRHTLRKG